MSVGSVDLTRVRAALSKLDEIAREHPEAFGDLARILTELDREPPTGREMARAARKALENAGPKSAQAMTPEVRAIWESTIAAIESFDEENDET